VQQHHYESVEKVIQFLKLIENRFASPEILSALVLNSWILYQKSVMTNIG